MGMKQKEGRGQRGLPMMIMIMGLGRPKIRNDSSSPWVTVIIASLCSLVLPLLSFSPLMMDESLLIFFDQTCLLYPPFLHAS